LQSKNTVLIKDPIYITSFASISPLGSDANEVWNNYLNPESLIDTKDLIIAKLKTKEVELIESLSFESRKYRTLDKTVLLALFSARQAFKNSGWDNDNTIGINIGSSRGATELFEKFHTDFIYSKKLNPLTSPNTTLGNISTWLASDLQVQGPVISHSITCSTALHSILNGIAWLNSGMSEKFIVGGSEAANTNFTVSQMEALKIYSNIKNEYPCKSLAFNKTQNTMVLGEGSAVFCLEKNPEKHVAKIVGYGFATEIVNHNVSISTNADCFQKSMRMAMDGFKHSDIDAVVMHAPGTIKGDLSEFNAITSIFGKKMPALTSNKWKIGHALGASGAFSLEMAILMLQHQKLIESPFYANKKQPKELKNILVNAVGFGGNAVSLLVSL
jgi:3-oxoacyl-[acyl-carrier-protein] synthase II